MQVHDYQLSLQGPTHLRPGFELGTQAKVDGKTKFFIFNHLVFNVLIHKTEGAYTRAQNSAYASSLAVDTSGRRLLAWPKDTPAEVYFTPSDRKFSSSSCACDHMRASPAL